jgi:hypothetical protein
LQRDDGLGGPRREPGESGQHGTDEQQCLGQDIRPPGWV